MLETEHSTDCPELPENFEIGQAMGGGDCFFDSVAKGIKQLKPDVELTAKSLRKVCKDLAVDNQQLKSKIVQDARNRHDPNITTPDDSVNDDDLWNAYLAGIEYTFDDVRKMRNDNPNLYQSLTSSKYGSTLKAPIWGRPDIEGQMICKKYNIKLHNIEKSTTDEGWLHQITDESCSKSVSYVDYNDANTIHIINRGTNHFEPILSIQEIQYGRQKSSDSSDYDDNKVKLDEELIRVVRNDDSEEKN